MSRVGHCIDNGPMEGFWGILKRECYYGRRFTDRSGLFRTVTNYISYYNTRRYQHRLFIQTPMEVILPFLSRCMNITTALRCYGKPFQNLYYFHCLLDGVHFNTFWYVCSDFFAVRGPFAVAP